MQMNCLPFLGHVNSGSRDGRLFHDHLRQVAEGAGLRALRPGVRLRVRSEAPGDPAQGREKMAVFRQQQVSRNRIGF